MTTQSLTVKCTDAGDRSQLPEPSLRREQGSPDANEQLNCSAEPLDQPQVPVRLVDLWSRHNCTTPTLKAYFENQCTSTSNPSSRLLPSIRELNSISKATTEPGSSTYPIPNNELFLFHCCAKKATSTLIQSFVQKGPSIEFARPNGYFSRSRAVYWTNSLDFAFAWGVFRATGKWQSPRRDDHFECTIYVSKVDLTNIPTQNGIYMVAVPECTEKEQRLVEVFPPPLFSISLPKHFSSTCIHRY